MAGEQRDWSWGEMFFGKGGGGSGSDGPGLLDQMAGGGPPEKKGGDGPGLLDMIAGGGPPQGGSSGGPGILDMIAGGGPPETSSGGPGLLNEIAGGGPSQSIGGGMAEGAKTEGRRVRDSFRRSEPGPPARSGSGYQESAPRAPTPQETWGRVEKQRAGRVGERIVGWVERRREERRAPATPSPSPKKDTTPKGYEVQDGRLVGPYARAVQEELRKRERGF